MNSFSPCRICSYSFFIFQVDRIWSLLPAFTILTYGIHSYLNDIPSPRLWIYITIALIWSIRLTFNFARKGGYSGTEDYRWQVLRSKMSDVQFTIFSITFISTAQIALLLSITSPACILYYSEDKPIGIVDYGFIYAMLACIMVESIADNDQWSMWLGLILYDRYTDGLLTFYRLSLCKV